MASSSANEASLEDNRDAEQQAAIDVLSDVETPNSTASSLRVAPFLHVRVQLWMRELSRLVASVGASPVLRFSADLTDEQSRTHLPLVHCRTCGAMGWTALRLNELTQQLSSKLDLYYPAFFRKDRRVVFLFPKTPDQDPTMAGQQQRLCTDCLTPSEGRNATCNRCGSEQHLEVFVPASVGENDAGKKVGLHTCPYCNAPDGLTLLGSRAATLISVLASQLFASRYNDDKKLLTFSDSVQDASHRAGFLAARTFASTLRCGLVQFLSQHGEDLTLDELTPTMRNWWLERLTPEAFIANFIAPDLTWLGDFERMVEQGTLRSGSRLLDKVCQRLDWEITSEMGLRARLGRTLERTGSACVRVVPKRFEAACQRIEKRLRNEIGGLRTVKGASVWRLALGLVTRLRHEGAIIHPALETYIKTLGNLFVVHRIHWMARFGSNTPKPSFLATHRGKGCFDVLVGRSQTWYEQWLVKNLGATHALVLNDTRAIYEVLLQELVRTEVLDEREAEGNHRVWGLRPDALLVTLGVITFACTRCNHRAPQASADEALWKEMPCLRGTCTGHYVATTARTDYYARLYREGDLVRIVTAEHTGLLGREEREQVETRFKAPAGEVRAGDPNLLSCTPTLEMGIDIGDLSSLILCSVPPSQASYLQRIGRAGRRDGNALNITLARSQAHDLYFFSEPKEMIAGNISSPGVFLDASAVLERQLTAYCLDRWVASGITPDALPRSLGKALEAVNKQATGSFPYTFIHAIELRQSEILNAFVGLFEGRLSDDSVDHLRGFLMGGTSQSGSLGWRLIDGLQRVGLERESLRKKARSVSDRIRVREQQEVLSEEQRKELAEMRREKAAMSQLARQLSERDTLGFMTDEGLIPNYAFPEAGVTLRSIINRKKDSDEGGLRSQPKTFDYERPAATAIAELAPANRFYAGKRRVRIDQVDVSVSEFETWRFCDQCSHSERIDTGDEHSCCVRCQSPFWSDSGQKRPMLRLRQVFATTEDRKSRIGDDSETREPLFYNRQMLVDFDPRQVRAAWQIDSKELPFGFELVTRVTFREVNFGLRSDDAQKVSIAGIELPRKGFRVCRSCGKVQTSKDTPDHAFSCSSRDKTTSAPMIDCVYLYRDFSSEALRIMLPTSTVAGAERKINSLVAALHLGLNRHFAGRIDHLRSTSYDEPVADSNLRKHYLVLYDTVPGGTGYLKELMRSPNQLFDALQQALDTLTLCPCNQHPDRDGCYRCLFAHRGRLDLKDISRDEAQAQLREILRLRDRTVAVDRLTYLNDNALLESELEMMFLEALQRGPKGRTPVRLTRELLSNGKAGYLFQVGESSWYLEPQVSLGQADGVKIGSRVDFLFRPALAKMHARPVAVFTDGLEWHKDRVGLDTAQRMAIRRQGWVCWSLSYRDVESRLRALPDWFDRLVLTQSLGGAQQAIGQQVLINKGLDRMHALSTQDSFAWLLDYLEKPTDLAWQWLAYAWALCGLNPQFNSKDWLASLGKCLPDELVEEIADDLGPAPTESLVGHGTVGGSIQWFVGIVRAKASDVYSMRVSLHFDDHPQHHDATEIFRTNWNTYLHLQNLFGFLPLHWFTTRQGIVGDDYVGLPSPDLEKTRRTRRDDEPNAWKTALQDCAVEASQLLRRLEGAGWPVPEVGYELTDAAGCVIASAELAWPARQLALLRDDEMGLATRFTQAGWTALAFPPEDDETAGGLLVPP